MEEGWGVSQGVDLKKIAVITRRVGYQFGWLTLVFIVQGDSFRIGIVRNVVIFYYLFLLFNLIKKNFTKKIIKIKCI